MALHSQYFFTSISIIFSIHQLFFVETGLWKNIFGICLIFKEKNLLPFYVIIVCIVVCVQSPMSSSQVYLRNIYFTVYFGRMLY